MRIYNCVKEAVGEIERDLAEMGLTYQSDTVQDKYVGNSDDFITKELMPYSYTLTAWGDIFQVMDKMGVPVEWALAELNERLNLSLENKNPGYAWHEREELWSEFLRDGCFSYTYPERMHWQFQRIIHELKVRPNTRQAIMAIYEPTRDLMNFGGRDRVPCSLSYHFLIRNGKLHVIYSQRSCDFKTFLVSDMFFACKLLECMADEIQVGVGTMIHNIASLHCFKKDLKGVF